MTKYFKLFLFQPSWKYFNLLFLLWISKFLLKRLLIRPKLFRHTTWIGLIWSFSNLTLASSVPKFLTMSERSWSRLIKLSMGEVKIELLLHKIDGNNALLKAKSCNLKCPYLLTFEFPDAPFWIIFKCMHVGQSFRLEDTLFFFVHRLVCKQLFCSFYFL